MEHHPRLDHHHHPRLDHHQRLDLQHHETYQFMHFMHQSELRPELRIHPGPVTEPSVEIQEGVQALSVPQAQGVPGMLPVPQKESPKPKRKRRRNRDANPDEWERKMNQKLRAEGKSYVSISVKDGKVEKVERPARELGPACNSKKCNHEKSRRKCDTFSEEERIEIHRKFWEVLKWDERKLYVLCLIDIPEMDEDKQKHRMIYHLYTSKHRRVEVCQQQFLNTLSISPKTLNTWIKNSEHGIPGPKKLPPPRTAIEMKNAQDFLKLLPKEQAKNSSKFYVQYAMIKDVYEDYTKHCAINQMKPASKATFSRAMSSANIEVKPQKKAPAKKPVIQQL